MGEKYTFAYTIGAIKEVCARCPDHDPERIGELFNENKYVELLDNMAWFISTLSKWSERRTHGSDEGALTEDDIMLMDMDEINDLFAQAMAAFKRDQKSETEIKPAKKTKAVSKSKK